MQAGTGASSSGEVGSIGVAAPYLVCSTMLHNLGWVLLRLLHEQSELGGHVCEMVLQRPHLLLEGRAAITLIVHAFA